MPIPFLERTASGLISKTARVTQYATGTRNFFQNRYAPRISKKGKVYYEHTPLNDLNTITNTAWGLQSIVDSHHSASIYSVDVKISGHKQSRIGMLYLLGLSLASSVVQRQSAMDGESLSIDIDYKRKAVSVRYTVVVDGLAGAFASTTQKFQVPPMYTANGSNPPQYSGVFNNNTVVGKDYTGWPGVISSSSLVSASFGFFNKISKAAGLKNIINKNQPLMPEFTGQAIVAETQTDSNGIPWQNPTPWFDGTGRMTDITSILTAALMPTITSPPNAPNTAVPYKTPATPGVPPDYVLGQNLNVSNLFNHTYSTTNQPKEGS